MFWVSYLSPFLTYVLLPYHVTQVQQHCLFYAFYLHIDSQVIHLSPSPFRKYKKFPLWKANNVVSFLCIFPEIVLVYNNQIHIRAPTHNTHTHTCTQTHTDTHTDAAKWKWKTKTRNKVYLCSSGWPTSLILFLFLGDWNFCFSLKILMSTISSSTPLPTQRNPYSCVLLIANTHFFLFFPNLISYDHVVLSSKKQGGRTDGRK
jgi:hypothetical protein